MCVCVCVCVVLEVKLCLFVCWGFSAISISVIVSFVFVPSCLLTVLLAVVVVVDYSLTSDSIMLSNSFAT